MQCNIDARGQAARLRAGLIMVVLSVIGAVVLWTTDVDPIWWWLVGGIATSGAFAIFEARQGWCVVRAMGFRTRI